MVHIGSLQLLGGLTHPAVDQLPVSACGVRKSIRLWPKRKPQLCCLNCSLHDSCREWLSRSLRSKNHNEISVFIDEFCHLRHHESPFLSPFNPPSFNAKKEESPTKTTKDQPLVPAQGQPLHPHCYCYSKTLRPGRVTSNHHAQLEPGWPASVTKNHCLWLCTM